MACGNGWQSRPVVEAFSDNGTRNREGVVPVVAQPPWDAQQFIPASTIPELPWSPPPERNQASTSRRIASLAIGPLTTVYAVATEQPWWMFLGTLFFVWPMYDDLRGITTRLTLTTTGFEVRGVLRKRTYTWTTIRALHLRRYEVTADLGRYGRQTWRFDGSQGRPSALEVAAALERLRHTTPTTPARRRATPTWPATLLTTTALTTITAFLLTR